MWARNSPAWVVIVAICLGLAPPHALADGPTSKTQRKHLARLAAGKVTLPPPTGKVYALEDLVDRALSQNPSLVARKHAEIFANLRNSEANWAYGPMVKVESSFTVVPAEADVNQVQGNLEKYLDLDIGPFSSSTIRVVIPIYTFGKISAARDLAELGVDAERLKTKKERLKLITQTREAYYSLQLGKHIQAITADARTVIKEEIKRQNEAREFGDEEIDIPQLRKLQILDAESDVKAIDTERLIALTRAALGALTGLDPASFDVPAFDEDDDTGLLLSLAVYLELAREHRPDLALLDTLVTARQRQVDLELSRFYPDLFFAAEFRFGYSTEEAQPQEGFVVIDGKDRTLTVKPFSNPYNYTRFGFLVGARMDYSPSQRWWKYKQAQAKLAEARAQRTAASEGIDLQIEERWRETTDERRKIEAYRRSLKAADRWRKQVAIAFGSGGATLKNFLEPIKAWFNARLKLLEAQYNFRVNLAKLGELVGLTNIRAIAQSMPVE
jgi:outer membrane protein TolC